MVKRIFVLSMIFLCILTLFGCRKQIVTNADELTSRNWKIQNPSGIEALLKFEDDRAVFIIRDATENKEAVIEGALATDAEKFYITSEIFCKTFEFGYRAFRDRAEIIYNGETLVFSPVEEASEKSANASADEYG